MAVRLKLGVKCSLNINFDQSQAKIKHAFNVNSKFTAEVYLKFMSLRSAKNWQTVWEKRKFYEGIENEEIANWKSWIFERIPLLSFVAQKIHAIFFILTKPANSLFYKR